MSKPKVITIDADKFLDAAEKATKKLNAKKQETDPNKELEIINASMRDENCSYGYELLTGKTKGDLITRKGIHIVHDDLQSAFFNLNVFLAHIDDVFSSDETVNNQTPLSTLEERDEVMRYSVSAFKITGVEENRAVILSGNKGVSQGEISFSTPKIKLGGSYLYIEELEFRLNNLIKEVELYMDGKTAPQYEQSSMEFPESFAEEDDAFEQGKVI